MSRLKGNNVKTEAAVFLELDKQKTDNEEDPAFSFPFSTRESLVEARRYGPLCGPYAVLPNLGHFWCSVVALVTFSRYCKSMCLILDIEPFHKYL